MSKRFGAQHVANGYAAMGGSLRRPRYSNASGLSVADSIAKARHAAASEARRKATKK